MNKQELSDYVCSSIELIKEIVDKVDNVFEEQHLLNRLSYYYKIKEKDPENLVERLSFIEKFKDYLITPHQKIVDNLDDKIVKLDNQKEREYSQGGLKIFGGAVATGVSIFAAFLHHPAFYLFFGGGLMYTIHSLFSTLHNNLEREKKIWNLIGIRKIHLGEEEKIKKIENHDLEEVLEDNKDYIQSLLYTKK